MYKWLHLSAVSYGDCLQKLSKLRRKALQISRFWRVTTQTFDRKIAAQVRTFTPGQTCQNREFLTIFLDPKIWRSKVAAFKINAATFDPPDFSQKTSDNIFVKFVTDFLQDETPRKLVISSAEVGDSQALSTSLCTELTGGHPRKISLVCILARCFHTGTRFDAV